MNQEDYRKLISGRSKGVGAMLLRFVLYLASIFYWLAVRLRNSLYSVGWPKAYKANAIVISVGNITTGGTGKTPLVIWLCKFLQEKEIQCAILTRGYKIHTKKRATRTDEPAILAESCPQAEVIVNPNRVAGANEAVNRFVAKVLIMDDGFQHRRLARDVDIVTIDATLPFGYGRMLPAGLLREPVGALKRADAAVITRCDQITGAELTHLEEKLHSVNPDMLIAKSLHAPICAKCQGDKEISIEELKNKKVFAFCGIGNPDAFLSTIKGFGARLVGSRIYDDHYYYSDDDITGIYEQAQNSKADLILTTQKDQTKIISDFRPIVDSRNMAFAYLAIELKFLAGEDKLRELIEDVLVGKIVSRES